MAVAGLTDHELDLRVELLQLERREAELAGRHAKAEERYLAFPGLYAAEQVFALKRSLAEMQERMDTIRATLLSITARASSP